MPDAVQTHAAVVECHSRAPLPSTLGWGAYLACSWTWCIGMFLPVLLLRDYGVWGFVVFAIPNVLGAAAMGWILRSRVESRLIARRHRPAAVMFSTVTIAFQIYFAASIQNALDLAALNAGAGVGPLIAGLALLVLFVVLGFRRWSLGVWASSLALLGLAACFGGLSIPSALPVTASAGDAGIDLLFMAPVCAFGFLLCPYLDLTFHRARQALDVRDARTAFSIGFGVLFLLMILGTLGYAAALLLAASDPALAPPRWARVALAMHVSMQLMFTCLVHAGQVLRQPSSAKRWIFWSLVVLGVLSAGALALGDYGFEHARVSLFEIGYRCFMAFYGLIFPAYVWLCVIPTRRDGGVSAPSRYKLAVLAGAVLLAAPCFWMGFIEREEVWLAPGLAIVLLARVLVIVRAGADRWHAVPET